MFFNAKRTGNAGFMSIWGNAVAQYEKNIVNATYQGRFNSCKCNMYDFTKPWTNAKQNTVATYIYILYIYYIHTYIYILLQWCSHKKRFQNATHTHRSQTHHFGLLAADVHPSVLHVCVAQLLPIGSMYGIYIYYIYMLTVGVY